MQFRSNIFHVFEVTKRRSHFVEMHISLNNQNVQKTRNLLTNNCSKDKYTNKVADYCKNIPENIQRRMIIHIH